VSKPKIDGAYLRRQVRRVTGMTERDEDFALALVMLSSAVVGPRVRRLASLTGLPYGRVREIGGMLRARGLWTRRKVHDSGWFEKDGGISFNLDIGVAKGLFDRVQASRP
jgi:hypothetical protein